MVKLYSSRPLYKNNGDELYSNEKMNGGMKMDKKCSVCNKKMTFLTTSKDFNNKEYCATCNSLAQKTLKINAFKIKKMSLAEIINQCEEHGVSLSIVNGNKEKLKQEVINIGISYKSQLNIIHGKKLIDTELIPVMYQLSDGRIIFNKNNPNFYELISIEFQGAKVRTVTTSKTKQNKKDDRKSKTKKNGKSGRVVLGGVIGTMLLPGVGSFIGASAGALGKGKSNTIHSGGVTSNVVNSSTSKDIEEKSETFISLKNISSKQTISLTVKTDTNDYQKLKSFSIVKTVANEEKVENDIFEELKKYKELMDLGIISDEEFNNKKKELL